jgi:hypothetical protein
MQLPRSLRQLFASLLIFNVTNPAAPGLSAEHGPLSAACGHGFAAVATPSMLAGHEPLSVACGHDFATAATPNMTAGHGPLCATRNRGPAATASLRWTCGRDSFEISLAKQQYK